MRAQDGPLVDSLVSCAYSNTRKRRTAARCSGKVAYLVNQYPKVSHTFIRREILALERLGIEVYRIALRGWDAELMDEADAQERKRTSYVMRGGLLSLLPSTAVLLAATPLRWLSTLVLAFAMARQDGRLAHHLAYFAEACRAVRWLARHNVVHTHAHFGTNSAEIAMLAFALGGPRYSFTVHGPEEFDRAQSLGLREKVKRAAFVVAISSYGRGQLFRWISSADRAKVKVVRCGLDGQYDESPAAPIPANPRVVCVGRLCTEKGQVLLVEAASRLAARGMELQVVLAGDGQERGYIEALIRKHRLQEVVRVTGWISGAQVRRELLAARALVLPSLAEGLPVVIMEAMALGRPVLTTWVAGIPELVRPGETGWLIPPGDVDELARGMATIVSAPVSELARMGVAGRARVMEHHSIDASAAALATHFRDCSTTPPS